mmetsp:Transcript_4087/g.9480  ORF Transcript_4087/g.9480 Transcript_4087/m.9480 type:complete len:740 (-) Transcript_4087:3220-5439(-)
MRMLKWRHTLLLLSLQIISQTRAQETDLGGGIVTRTNVKYMADLTLDIKDMTQSFGNSDLVLDIYDNGRNAQQPSGLKFKLKELSDLMSSKGITEATPTYLFQLYGLAEESTDLNKVAQQFSYANNNVRVAITGGKDHAPQAALVFTMWMYAAHVLYQGIDQCQKMTEADNPELLDLGGGGMDEFIALWIGTGETHSGTDGFGLYALAQKAASLFDGGNIGGEAIANNAIKLLYHEGSQYLSVNGACTKDVSDTPKLLYSVVSRIMSIMYIPLIQMLIDSILAQDADLTVLYATAIIPQAAQCRVTTYNRLREHLLTGLPRFDKTEIILRDIQDIYACFGLMCEDVGAYMNTPSDVSFPFCTIAKSDASMAGYQPTSDVLPVAQIDLDIAQMRILTKLGNFKYAKYWFTYGRNSPVQRDSDNDLHSFYSLSDLAVASSRKNAEDIYSDFVAYFNDVNYSQKIIMGALEGTGKWGLKSIQQRSAVATESSAFLVVYLHMIAQINDAVKQCKNEKSDGEYDLTHPWDEVAALVIGSLEGTQEGGATDGRDGQLIWGLNTRRGFQFQTLNDQGYSRTNSDLIDALWAGRGEIDALDCDRLESTAENIKRLTLIPLLQSIVRYAVLNEGLEASSTKEDLALGETYALAVLPIIDAVDENSGEVIRENMIHNDKLKPVSAGAQKVADAVGAAAVALGIKCSHLGSTSQADPCRNIESSSAIRQTSLIFPTLIGLGASIWYMLLL